MLLQSDDPRSPTLCDSRGMLSAISEMLADCETEAISTSLCSSSRAETSYYVDLCLQSFEDHYLSDDRDMEGGLLRQL